MLSFLKIVSLVSFQRRRSLLAKGIHTRSTGMRWAFSPVVWWLLIRWAKRAKLQRSSLDLDHENASPDGSELHAYSNVSTACMPTTFRPWPTPDERTVAWWLIQASPRSRNANWIFPSVITLNQEVNGQVGSPRVSRQTSSRGNQFNF